MPLYSTRRPLEPREKDAFPGYSDLLAHLLFHRGITDAKSAAQFIQPDYVRDTHNPSLLKDADKASARIIEAIEKGQKIAIYSDYDCDGIPGAAMFHDLFRRIGYKNFVIYIPHRHNEGFGVNKEAIDDLAGQGVTLLITVDCGISDFEAIKHAQKKGIEVIITDHHEPPEKLPPAIAVIDPKQLDCEYPDKNLCGTGVAFKLIQAVLAENRFGLKEGHEKWLLDLVGIATLSDMVSLTGVLRKSPRKGLQRLLAKLKISQQHLTEDDIAFMITPRINAASRMGVPMDAFNLLVADNDAEADKCADHLDHINNERKGVVASLVKAVKKLVHERHGSVMPSVIVLGNPEWRPSLLGLAANSCAEEFRRPVFLWGRDGEGGIKGSCRSEGTTHVVELMRAMPVGTLTEFGGHKHSGGFGVLNDSIHYLEERLNEAAVRLNGAAVSGDVSGNGPIGVSAGDETLIDSELSMNDVGFKLHEDLNKLAPFGIGNGKPVFLFRKVVPSSIRLFGKGNEHVELVFNKANGAKISAISFFGAPSEWAKALISNKASNKAASPVDLVASVEKSMFRNRPEIRLRIVDVIYS
ncbi:MAG: single-stranded-DNA-specific exonuclease RecJ [Candidatus Taylorbacteria bacterium]|nr:single-stranded-DNA-specific exonuclease RecJ [Candidatus Taylorbacteria bacterium]